ncbi:MAG: YbjQ family protein [Paracoccaceae bacterium]
MEKVAKTAEYDPEQADAKARVVNMMLTTETAHDLPVAERLGIVTAEVLFGVNAFRDMFADVRGVFGGRAKGMQYVQRDARNECIAEISQEAAELGADAVVGVDLDYQELGSAKMIMLVMSGRLFGWRT